MLFIGPVSGLGKKSNDLFSLKNNVNLQVGILQWLQKCNIVIYKCEHLCLRKDSLQ